MARERRDGRGRTGLAEWRRGGSERACGVWVVDLATGRTVAFLRFEGAVQELSLIHI